MHNQLRQLLGAGKAALGAQLRFGSPVVAELFGHAGFDFLIIDCEHAAQDPPGVQAQMQAISGTKATPLVRIGQTDGDLIRLYLDMGAAGIVAPMVSTAEEAERIVKACRYPPQGTRSAGASRAARFGFDPDYFRQSNDQVIVIPIIETTLAVKNIKEIFSVDGISSYIMGPVDLSVSLGVPWQTSHPKVRDATDTVLEAAKEAGITAGCGACGSAATSSEIKAFVEQGYKMFWIGGDEWLLADACRQIAQSFKALRNE